jgi:hypothetical protein
MVPQFVQTKGGKSIWCFTSIVRGANQMNKRALAFAAASTILAGANAWAGGYGEGDKIPLIANLRTSVGFGDLFGENVSVLTGEGGVTVPLYGMKPATTGAPIVRPNQFWSLQFNAAFLNIRLAPESLNGVDAVAHITYNSFNYAPATRTAPSKSTTNARTFQIPSTGFRIGGYVGLVDPGVILNERVWTGGVEGQALINPKLQLEGRLGFYSVENETATNFYAGANFFATSNLALNLHGWSTTGNASSGNGLGVRVEYDFTRSPFGLFATVDRLNAFGETSTAGRVGVNLNFGRTWALGQAVEGPSFGDGLMVGTLPLF